MTKIEWGGRCRKGEEEEGQPCREEGGKLQRILKAVAQP